MLPTWCVFKNRQHGQTDITNRLLDIGYHHITNLVKKILEKYNIEPGLGILHIPHETNSAPLAYDLVEIFRSDIVDTEALRFLRLKKKPFLQLEQKYVAYFLHRINKRLAQKHFVEVFGQCCSYEYYVELQILRFIKAVNHKEIFDPVYLPNRHDMRCSKKSSKKT